MNFIGSYDCKCSDVFEDDKVQCYDNDECHWNPCDENAIFDNTIDSSDCACHDGSDDNGVKFEDKCFNGSAVFDKNAAYSNHNGSYGCTCNIGFTGDYFKCSDINQCKEGNHDFDSNVSCAYAVRWVGFTY